MAKSGGVTARNTRQGFRSEYIARYIFSAFGTAVEVSQGNDIGIDILCSLTYNEGKLIIVKSSYGVQVKSKNSKFKYKGKQATTWLSKLEYPLLLASVDKKGSKIKIYSTWNLNRYLLSLHTEDEQKFPDEICFVTSKVDGYSEPDNRGNIPVGKPILEFDFSDINNNSMLNKYYKVLSEWLEIDNRNYLLRRAGISCAFGYTKWETNQSIDESIRTWYKPYFYSPYHIERIKEFLAEAFVPIGLYNKGLKDGDQSQRYKDEFNDLKRYIDKYLFDKMGDHGKDLFKYEI